MNRKYAYSALAAVAALLVVVAFTSASTSHHPQSQPDPGSSARLVVFQRFNVGGGLWTEGSKSYLRVRGGQLDSQKVFFQPSKHRPVWSRLIAPGRYTLRSWQRPCDGNCGYLDPPTAICGKPVALTAGHTTTVTVIVNPGKDSCKIVQDSAPAGVP